MYNVFLNGGGCSDKSSVDILVSISTGCEADRKSGDASSIEMFMLVAVGGALD